MTSAKTGDIAFMRKLASNAMDFMTPGSVVRLRDGRKAIVSSIEERGIAPVLGAGDAGDVNGRWHPLSWRRDGTCPYDNTGDLDIVAPWEAPARMVVAVDFDGVLCRNSYPEIGEEILGAMKFLSWLEHERFAPVLWTCREDETLDAALAWLSIRGFHREWWAGINDNAPCMQERYGTSPRKVGASVYVDDAGIGLPMLFGTPDWPRIKSAILLRRRLLK